MVPSRTTTTLSGAMPFETMRSRMSSPSTITRAACFRALPMHLLPALHPFAGPHDIAADGHVRIQIADVVHKGAARHSRDERAGDSRDRRVGHGQNHVRPHSQRPRNRQREIGKIIRNAPPHLMPRIGGGTHAFDRDVVALLPPQKSRRDKIHPDRKRAARQPPSLGGAAASVSATCAAIFAVAEVSGG